VVSYNLVLWINIQVKHLNTTHPNKLLEIKHTRTYAYIPHNRTEAEEKKRQAYLNRNIVVNF